MKIINEIILPFIKTILLQNCCWSKMSICFKVESAKDIPNMESWISSMYDKKVFKINIVQTRPERRERGGKCTRLFWGKTEEMWKKREGRRGWRRKKAKWEKLRISRNKTSLRMSPTLLWTFDWATLGSQRHLWSTTTWTQCGMKSSELRFVVKDTSIDMIDQQQVL